MAATRPSMQAHTASAARARSASAMLTSRPPPFSCQPVGSADQNAGDGEELTMNRLSPAFGVGTLRPPAGCSTVRGAIYSHPRPQSTRGRRSDPADIGERAIWANPAKSRSVRSDRRPYTRSPLVARASLTSSASSCALTTRTGSAGRYGRSSSASRNSSARRAAAMCVRALAIVLHVQSRPSRC